jgi:phosphoglycolate phosphatase-like HAD superfamily hydrolase
MGILTALIGAAVPGAGLAIAVAKFGAKTVFGKIGGAISSIPWAKVWWLIPIALALGFGLYRDFQYRKIERKIPALEQRAANSHTAFLLEKKAFATEKASLDAANRLLDANNKRILAEAADFDQAKRDAAAAQAKNAKLAQSTNARIAELQTAATHHTAPCTLSSAARKALEDQ